jgi:hypothetical protein
MSKPPTQLTPLAAIGMSAVSFYLLFQLNNLLFEKLDYTYGVSWLFLPSGLRLALVLLFGFYGAIGVMLGTLLIGLGDDTTWVAAVLPSLISGLAPWLALDVSRRMFHLQTDLSNLNAALLLKMALVFAVISAVAHQLLYLSLGLTENFLKSTSVMAIGDLLGTLVVLYGLKLMMGRRPKQL